MLELFLGQIPEAIYFALFIIFTKQLKEKRILFIILMILEYTILLRAIPFSLYSHIGFFVMTYIILKIGYKEKVQITDIFTLGIASILLTLINAILYFTIYQIINNYVIYVIIDRIILFLILFILRNKLNVIQKTYKKLWNRNDKEKKIMKTTTFRSLNLVIFNLSFYILNIILLYCVYKNTIN